MILTNDNKHLIVNGKNEIALNLLNGIREYDFILIDPPYNSQNKNNEGFKYNDTFSDMEWDEFMKKRLTIARELLKEDGAMAIHIDDNQYAELRILMNKIFGKENYVNTIVLSRTKKNISNQFEKIKRLPKDIEFVLIYKKSDKFYFKKPYKDSSKKRKEGYWQSFHSNADRPTMRYKIGKINISEGQWKWSKERGLRAYENYKYYLKNFAEKMTIREYWIKYQEEYMQKTGFKLEFVRPHKKKAQYFVTPSNTSLMGTNMIDWLVNEVYGKKMYGFETVKNLNTTKKLIEMFTNQDAKILDFFAGSGTTGHAVMELNKETGSERIVTLITNNENDICSGICYPRMKEVAKEYNQQFEYIVLE
ncbi:TPA: site-specific DNA-methyltransferase [Clostridium botulinum]|nr:site-specific DNA-methyltransferase [Clostridium botulinum]